jgi:M6 family metalloprotease-like protein
MKKIVLAIVLSMVFLSSIAFSAQGALATSKVDGGKKVSIEGYLVVEEVFGKQPVYSLRDKHDKMTKLEFAQTVDLSGYAGKKIEVTGFLDASGTEEVVKVVSAKPLESGAPSSQSVFGEQKTMVLMGYFTDRTYTKSIGDVYRTVFNDMGGYYAAESYDRMYVNGSWSGWVQLSQTVGYYGNANPSWWFIRDLVAKVDSYVNFAGYSKFLFVNAGPNEESSGIVNDIWSARWSGLNIATNDGVTITHGAIVPDIEAGSYGNLGVFCHEYGHELGLPDLYTYAADIEQYDLMDMGSWNNNGWTPSGFTSYCKNFQGWIYNSQIYTVVSMSAEYLRLDPLEDPTATISVIKVPYGSDYFFIEARRKVGFDAYLPAERVLVLWINATSNRPYLKASLSVGGQYESGSFGIKVMSSDTEGWSYNVYVWYKTWSGDMRLTNAASESNTNWGHTALATVSYNVYATWDDYRDGNWEIYFKRSVNWGSTWVADVRLTSNTANSWYPSIAAYGSYVYIAWQEYRDGNWEIYLRRSENFGVSWPYGDQRLTNNNMTSTRPSVAVYGRYVYVVWEDNRAGNPEIYFKRSTDNGLNWGADTRLTINASGSYLPNVAAYGAYVHVVWEDGRSGNWDIRYRRSTNYGASWGTDTAFTTNTAEQRFPSIAAWGYDVYVTWTDYRYGASNTEIFIRRSLNSGSSFLTEQRLTSYSYLSSFAVVACKGTAVYVVWQDNRTGTWEVYFKESPNRGLYWTNDKRLSATPNTSQWPSIAVGGMDWGDVYVAWTDYRNAGNSEIYFKYRY